MHRYRQHNEPDPDVAAGRGAVRTAVELDLTLADQ
jgi:hypothetical protein